MKKVINFVILLIIVGVGAVYFTWGPNIFFGGPKNSDIIEVTKTVMIATSGSEEKKALVATAKITPKGICNKMDSKFACAVNISLSDGSSKDFVAVLQKNATGTWLAVD